MAKVCKDCGEPVETWAESEESFQQEPLNAYHHITLTEQVEWCMYNRPQVEILAEDAP